VLNTRGEERQCKKVTRICKKQRVLVELTKAVVLSLPCNQTHVVLTSYLDTDIYNATITITNALIMEELKVPNRLSTLVNKRML
jgi:hypothetical protein